MMALKRFRSLSKMSKYYYCTNVLRSPEEHKNIRNVKACDLTGIPNAEKLYFEYSVMRSAESTAKKSILDEFIKESKISRAPWFCLERAELLKLSINELVENNLVPSLNAVVNGLLRSLERFPFDSGEIAMNASTLSVKQVRDIIKKQYLAWKFKTDVQDITLILQNFGASFYDFQSLTNLRKNIDILESLPEIYQRNVTENIYFIHQITLNVSLVTNFQAAIVGVNFHAFPEYCPKILKHSYQNIMFLVTILQEMQFTHTQIKESLPFIHISFDNFLKRLNYIVTHPEIAKYRNEDKFLLLLSQKSCNLGSYFSVQSDCFSEVINILQSKEYRGSKNLNLILNTIKQCYGISSTCKETLKRYPNYRFVPVEQIIDTLNFLKSNGFDEAEVEESITIVFYPREIIQRALEQIKTEEVALRRYGFRDGCVLESTNFFEIGTKLEKKRLQLCLYYIGKLV